MTKKVFFLHIGLPKTETSYIQNVLHHQQGILETYDAHYLQAGQNGLFNDHGNHLLAVSLMEHRWDEIQLQVDRGAIISVWEELRSEIDETPYQNIIASTEWFAFDVHEDDQLLRLKEKLSNYHVVIVLVLRDVVDFVNSTYSQSVRDGFAGSVTDFIIESWYSLDWATIADRWARFFGADNVRVLRFDRLQQGDIASEFVAAVCRRRMPIQGNVAHNKSLPMHATRMISMINGSDVAEEAKIHFRNAVKDLFTEIPLNFSPGSHVSDDVARILRTRCIWPHVSNA